MAKTFLQEYQWSEWIPGGGVIAGSVGEGDSLKTGIVSASGDLALVYFSNNSPTRIKNTLDKTAKTFWFDPRNGKQEPVGRFEKNEVRDMIPPSRWEDAILVLRAE